MADYDVSALTTHPLDYRLAGGPVLFWRREVLDDAIAWLRTAGYQIVTLDAGAWTRKEDMHRDFAAALDFPSYYGANLDALSDCLSGVGCYEHGTSESVTGLALVLENYDKFVERDRRVANAVLQIYTEQAQGAALFGHRMLCLVHSSDPHLVIDDVVTSGARWNDAEWFASKRTGGNG